MRDEPREVEAKFLVRDPAVLSRLARLRSLETFRLKSSRLELQENRYLDTKDLRLRQAKAVLKMRLRGARAEMTFKREISQRGGVSERIEVTSPLFPYSAPSPRPLTLPSPPSGGEDKGEGERTKVRGERGMGEGLFCLGAVQRARKIVGSRPLQEILNLHTRRRSLIFARGRERVELDLDRVEVFRDGKAVARYSEIELENLTASGESFRELLGWWKRSFRGEMRSSRVPKVEMGLRLLKKLEEDR